ncbi:hypothetical protein AAV94_07730 [Lampropedia cohaerens]|uniref:Uncharacterized protein n=1 Tax=Lampropedia cohaerens TaxID=1610491 RepID=A0A0U1Q0A6_9BURK|nr:FUSC family protein [Lampropedia cohaerens]KKW68035.1 hypothetical protein AAV94_07730 [Lampropedia cohaerens]
MSATDAVIAAGISLLEASEAWKITHNDTPHSAQRPLVPPSDGGLGPANRMQVAAQMLRDALQWLRRDDGVALPADAGIWRLRAPSNPQRCVMAAMMALISSLGGSLAIILTGSFSAELTAFSMAVFALVIGSMPLPQALTPKVAIGVIADVILGALYRIGVQPYTSGWLMLVLGIAPFMIVGALAKVPGARPCMR